MTHPNVLDRDRAALVVIDVQEAFRKAISGFEDMADGCVTLARGARALGLPLVATEQYPRGLGDTVPEVAEALGATERLDKVVFSACRADGFDLGSADQVVVCGIEAHVCVSQTVHDLLDQGVAVQVAVDAIASRDPADRELALRKMERSGAVLTSVETALLELVGR
ncbi:MAG TPA: isochorismatase family protein, partial [Solirubrobacteraceae bacterium]